MGDIQVRVVQAPGERGQLSGNKLVENLRSRVGEVSDGILAVSDGLQQKFNDATEAASSTYQLDEIEVTFSIELEAEAGVIVSKASTTAGFEVSLHWSRK